MVKRIIKKMNKRVILFTLFFIMVCFFLIQKRDYELTYSIDSIEIIEKYSKKDNLYTFIFKNDNKEYIVKFIHKYINKKKLVSSISINSNDNEICIIPSGKLSFYPLCYKNDEFISYQLTEDKELLPSNFYQNVEIKTDEYNQIKINYLNNKKYFIWNYKGFDIIEKDNYKTVNLFSEDIYNIPLSYKGKSGILIADYSSKYNFNKFYFIKSNNNKVKEVKTDKDLAFEAYILGAYKNNIYFVDKKNQKEYEINTKKLRINDLTKNSKGKILENEEWQSISMTKLSTEEYHFLKVSNIFDYQIIDERLYLVLDGYKQLVSDTLVKDIVEIDDETVYYIVDDKLYMFNPLQGEILLLSCFEWNFNYKNMIYIF